MDLQQDKNHVCVAVCLFVCVCVFNCLCVYVCLFVRCTTCVSLCTVYREGKLIRAPPPEIGPHNISILSFSYLKFSTLKYSVSMHRYLYWARTNPAPPLYIGPYYIFIFWVSFKNLSKRKYSGFWHTKLVDLVRNNPSPHDHGKCLKGGS